MDVVINAIKEAVVFFFDNIIFFNLFFAIVIVFFERRSPKSVWAWLLLLYFIPIAGFIVYLLAGQDIHKRRMFKDKEVRDRIRESLKRQERYIQTDPLEGVELKEYRDLIVYNLETSDALLTSDNDIDIFVEGNKKFDALMEDIEKAENFIHIEYYIIKNDELFNRIKEVLLRKVKEGVKVRILYDDMGCRSVSRSYWKKLNKAGIETVAFFPAAFRKIQYRMNYRNHRKIVVIDNKIGYVGGFNIGREYIDLSKRFGHWRDTHLRIAGKAVISLEDRFLLDWNYAANKDLFLESEYTTYAGPDASDEGQTPGNCDVQIITSGPDNSLEQIRDNYLKLINGAKKRICIQTPYFIPDEAIMSALLMAARSGIEVNLMIPSKPDHLFVFWANHSYMGELAMAGAKCYLYNNGFIHSKLLIVDDKVFCCGTANMDIRSFSLNFEVNAVVYNKQKAKEMMDHFKDDILVSTLITAEMYERRKLFTKIRESMCRLLSPLL